MKHLLLLFLGCVPMFISAQTLTEIQKQEALQCVIDFCNLLVRYSNGERTLTTQINALCSGADCSAYDDIKTNKEITLRNYLMAIQQKYPNKLPMAITAPSLTNSRIYVEPTMNLNIEWGNTGNSETSTAEMAVLSVQDINNTFIVFNVIQKYSSLGKSLDKKLIYDVKNKKITAFITTEGTFMNYLNGLMAFADNKFKSAMVYFDKAAQNERSSLKQTCYTFAMVSSVYIPDYAQAVYYAEKMKDPLYIAFCKCVMYLDREQFEESLSCALQCDSLMETRTDITSLFKRNVYLLLANCYVNPVFQNHNYSKALSYLKKAEELGDTKVGYFIFLYYMLLGEDFVSPYVAFAKLQQSAESGYPPAFYHWGSFVEYGKKDVSEAFRWYEKAAQAGNYVGMACVGKLLIEKGEKDKGVEWLKKSLVGDGLDVQLKDYDFIEDLPHWPKKREDVETLLDKYNNYSGFSNPEIPPTYTPSTSSSSNLTSNSNASSNYSYSSTSNRRYRKFNKARDNFWGGISAGYVQKQWVYDVDGTKEKIDVFGYGKYVNGFQLGIRIDPQFGYGFGINTGLFYEYYSDKSDDWYEDGMELYFKSKEHCLYIPIHLKYSLNFSRWFQLAFYGGIGLDCGLSGKAYLCGDGETYDSISLYDDGSDMKRFNATLEYGLAMRIRWFQLDFTMSKGLIDMSDSDEYKVTQNKVMTISASVCF